MRKPKSQELPAATTRAPYGGIRLVTSSPARARATMGKTSSKAQQKRRRRPPWGNILGGKPIERNAYLGAYEIDQSESARETQYDRMRSLMRHYGIVGPVPTYPVAGIAVDAGWWSLYEFALAIASELDDSLKIVDAKPRGKTAPRWRGVAGLLLLEQVDQWRKRRPNRSIRWCLRQLQKTFPKYYGQIAFDQLKVRYQEVKQRHRGTK